MSSEAPTPVQPEKQPGLFDMKDEIVFFENNLPKLKSILAPRLEAARSVGTTLPDSIIVKNPNQLSLPPEQLAIIFNLFPESARLRSTLRVIEGKPPRYFSKASQPGKFVITEKVEEALSPSAINPAEVYLHDTSAENPQSTLTVFALPENLKINDKDVTPEARALLYTHKLVHDIAHTSINDMFLRTDKRLKLPSGEIVDGGRLLQKFQLLALQKGPISNYDGAYRKGNDFVTDQNDPKVRNNAITESLAEAIAAKITGFTYTNDENRQFNPFADRPEIERFVDMYLSARPVTEQQTPLAKAA